MPKHKICLCFSDTGGGHRSAVDAIEAAIRNELAAHPTRDEFEVCAQNIIERTHPVNRGFVDFYNYLLRHNQAAMRYYYWFIETFKPNNSEIGYQLARKWLEDFIEQEKPEVIVSAHPHCNHYLARVLKDTGKAASIKLVVVVTDPNGNFWRGWACHEADMTLVPNDLGAKQLIEWGIAPEKIKVVGMPVHPDFSKESPISREEFRRSLRLSPEKLTVCINAGWAGGGNMLTIYRLLAQSKRDLQVIFLCGHNKKLYDQVKKEAALHDTPTAVLPFHDRMSDLMNAVDLMVTKAGGLTTFESLARKLPMAFDMITKPMPQEMGTVNMLIEQKLAYPVEKASDIDEIIENFQPIKDRQHHELPSVHQLDRVYASAEIARYAMGLCDPAYASVVDDTEVVPVQPTAQSNVQS